MRCPECGKEYDVQVSEMEDKNCRNCGTSLIKGLPGYPNRKKAGASSVLKISWDIFRGEILSLLRYLIVPVFIISVLSITAFFSINAVYDIGTLTASVGPERHQLLKMGLVVGFFSLIQWILQLIFMGGIVRFSRDAFVGRKVTAHRALSTVKNRLLCLTGASILFIIILIGPGLLSALLIYTTDIGCLGLICLLVSIILFVLFYHWFLYTLPILVLERRNPLSSIFKSRRLSISKIGSFKFSLMLLLLFIPVNGVILGPVAPIAWSGTFFEKGFSYLALQISMQVLFTLLMLLVLSFWFICITVNYLRISR
ncbi:MAG: hypothetical protein R6V04_05460 [bacterium]